MQDLLVLASPRKRKTRITKRIKKGTRGIKGTRGTKGIKNHGARLVGLTGEIDIIG
jgi:hypothetical protein